MCPKIGHCHLESRRFDRSPGCREGERRASYSLQDQQTLQSDAGFRRQRAQDGSSDQIYGAGPPKGSAIAVLGTCEECIRLETELFPGLTRRYDPARTKKAWIEGLRSPIKASPHPRPRQEAARLGGTSLLLVCGGLACRDLLGRV